MKADYLKKSRKQEVISSWVRFLKKLGVKTGIDVHRVNVNVPEVHSIMNPSLPFIYHKHYNMSVIQFLCVYVYICDNMH